jgi:hypothetical protein
MKRSRVIAQLGWTSFALVFIWPLAMIGVGWISELSPENLGTYFLAFFGPWFFFFVATLVLFVGPPIANLLHASSILANGISAEAKILKLAETGTTINDRPLVRFSLEVYPAGRPPFRAEAEKLISILDIPRLQPGKVVPVKYDPNSNEVALALPTDWVVED